MMGTLCGCVTVNSPALPSPTPLFQADTVDTVILQTVQREQEALLGTCTQSQSCDQVHFTRGMIALFKNGEAAAASFQQAIAAAPNGPFADPSALWIRFLTNRNSYPDSPNEPTGALLDVMKGTVRAWLGRQRPAGETAKSTTVETVRIPDPTVHSLQLQVRTRDKRIAELTDQLEALKQIDLDSHGASKRTRPRTSAK
ncbi:MAG: hypothetical protein CAF45_003220 [Nitrospira sp. CG24E]|nr:MAG: hypothetical protein CAF45_003220 [Nitrospira sp. CG24E]